MSSGKAMMTEKEVIEWATRIYHKLLRVAPDLLQIEQHAKSRVDGYMDLNLDVLESSKGFRRIALSHYWKHEAGDLIPDPDMEIVVLLDWDMAWAITYQDIYRHDEVYPVPGGPPDGPTYMSLNSFLENWLDALAEQGHVLRAENEGEMMSYRCACGLTAYRCNKCGWQWCSSQHCRKGNGKDDNLPINKCPRCKGYGSTS